METHDVINTDEKKVFLWFQLWNSISFHLLNGNIITLLVLKYGATDIFIGTITSFISFSQIMLIAGRMLSRKIAPVKLFRTFWLFRYLSMIPVLTIWLIRDNSAVLAVCALSVLFFSITRGIGFTTHNAIVAEISEKNKGSFIFTLSVIFQSCSLVISLLLSFVFRFNNSVPVYLFFIGMGITAGIISSRILHRLPEQENVRLQSLEPVRNSLYRNFRNHRIALYMAGSFFILMIFNFFDPFITVFFKEFGHSDSELALYFFFGNAGSVMVAMLGGKLIQKSGARIFIFIFTAVDITVLAMMSYFSRGIIRDSAVAAACFFFLRLSMTGMMTSQTVFLFNNISEKRDRLNMTVIQQMSIGAAGFAGANAGGFVLDYLKSVMHETASSYSVFFGVAAAALGIVSAMIFFMKNDQSGDEAADL